MRSILCLILCLSCATAISGGGRGHIQVYVDQNSTLPGTGSGTSADPFKTIADALAYVIPHDYILVAPGIYAEPVHLTQSVWLRSLEGPDKTIIDGTGQGGTFAITGEALCEVTGFTITKQDGGGMMFSATTAEYGRLLKGNRILDCPGGGLHLDGPLHPAISETVIVNCGFGVKLTNGASPFLTGFTVTNCGVGMEHSGPAWDPTSFFANSIFWGNTTELSGFTPGDLINCDVGDAAYIGVNGCISADPMWRDAGNRDFRLLSGSPCIDAGSPWYTLTSSEFDNRGYGAWRRMDGDHDGTVTPDIGSHERIGLATGQSGTGPGSTVWAEIDTGPGTEWWMAIGTFGAIPTTPLPLTGSSFFFFLDEASYTLIANAFMGPTGRYTFAAAVPPWAIGQEFAVQALGADYSSGAPVFNFTGTELLKIN